jgi:phosphoribosylaminoimidazole-succinocarboxamide synthase
LDDFVMHVTKKTLLYSGKAKTLYATDHDEYLIADFRDDTTAFDGIKKEAIQNKGKTNCAISNKIMHFLSANGIKTHFVAQLSDHEIIVRKLTMLPLESVVRNMAAGSLCRRLGIAPKTKFTPPLFEFFYKNDALHDPLVTREHALAFGWASAEQLQGMHDLSLRIHALLTKFFADHGMLLVDAKYEFGIDASGEIMLADEVSPDSCRIWDAETMESLDKDRFRQDMGRVIESYMEIAQRIGCR